jgi:hypothetical protein
MPTTPSYANPGGTGNRTASIVITTTATFSVGTVSMLINGSLAFEAWWASGQTGREIRFDFGTAQVITEAKWYQSNTVSHGTWQWQGSSDASAWTNIGATFTLGPGTSGVQTITELSGNTTPCRYYRILQTTGATSNSPYLQEIEFKIGDVADAPAVIDARLTQIGLEQWGPGAPVAQVTQTGLEVWGAISAVSRSALITQLAVEQWASVPLPPVTASQTAVSVNTG